jgi:CheY-like chemotaxis protein
MQSHKPTDCTEDNQETAFLSRRSLERARSFGLSFQRVQPVASKSGYYLDGRTGTLTQTGRSRRCLTTSLKMPIRDGYSATHAIRTEAPWKDIPEVRGVPIVAMTASAIQGDKEKCTLAGMDVSLLLSECPYLGTRTLIMTGLSCETGEGQAVRESELCSPTVYYSPDLC